MADKEFFVRFWGVRGSVPSPGPHTAEYGGNTSCVEIRCDGRVLVFDAGSGFRQLGNQLVKEGVDHLDLFLTHAHYDHILGLPFFAPFYSEETTVDIRSGHANGETTTSEMIRSFMNPPFFPVSPDVFRARVGYHDFAPGSQLDLPGDIVIRTVALNHSGGAVGYRVDFDGRSVCYITDTEHVPDRLDQGILELIQGSDIMIYDATYCDSELEQFVGFGHSTWQEGIRLCREADVDRYCIFHHRPSRDDQAMRKIEKEAQAIFANSMAAREGMQLIP